MALTPEEKVRVRYHLGYLNVQPAASLSFGIPKPQQTMFLVEQSMDLLIAGAEDIVRRLIGILDSIECKLLEAAEYLVAESIGDLKLREKAPQALEQEYGRWAKRLADTLGVPLYPFSARFSGGSGGAGNVPVL